MPSSLCDASSATRRATLFLSDRIHKISPTLIDLAGIPLLGSDEHLPLPRSSVGYLDNGLKLVSKCGALFENLKVYVSSGIDLSTHADVLSFRDDSNRRFCSTWSACGTALITPTDQHLDSIYGASGWFYLQANQKYLILSCEIAIRDEGQHQILRLTTLQAQV